MSLTSFHLEQVKERAERVDAAVDADASTNRIMARLVLSQGDVPNLVTAVEAALAVLAESLDDWEQRDRTHKLAEQVVIAIGEALGGKK